MKKNCAFLIVVSTIMFTVCGVGFSNWLAPVLLDEINDNSGHNPESPGLSSDELTLYYVKYNTSRGYRCLYESRRETLCHPFVKTRMLEELLVEEEQISGPWVSTDGQRLYYHETLSAGSVRIKMAVFDSDSNLWVPTVIFNELGTAAAVSLSANELIITGHMLSPNSSLELFIASRQSINLPFGNFRALSELNTINADHSPHLSSDGLTIYFTSVRRYGKTTTDLYMATRPSVEDIFLNIELIELPGYNNLNENSCFVSSDENAMYFDTSEGIWELHNSDKYPMLEIVGDNEIGIFSDRLHYHVRIKLSECEYTLMDQGSEVTWSIDPPEIYGWINSEGYFYPENEVTSGQFVISAEYKNENQILTASKTVYCISDKVVYFIDGENGNDSNNGLNRENAFATIMRGIEACDNGNAVYVMPGIYSETIDFTGKAITVSGLEGAAIIDGTDGFGVSFFNGEDSSTVLKNFVIHSSYIGIYMSGSSPTIQNVTVAGNTYGIEAYQGSNPDINNSIVWDNAGNDLFGCQAKYSCIEQGSEGVGNIFENPLFVNAAGGDYHLLSERGRHHAEYGVWVIDNVTSPCINKGNPETNPLNEPSPNGGRINMGAYGSTPEASMGEWVLKGDLNRDGKINIADLSEIASEWLVQLQWLK